MSTYYKPGEGASTIGVDIDEFLANLPQIAALVRSNSEENDKHDCTCKVCRNSNFTGYRYRCLLCDDYDVCSGCYENKGLSYAHRLSHLMVRFDDPDMIYGEKVPAQRVTLNYLLKIFASQVHVDFKCDVCNQEPIRGVRVKCETCKCEFCYECYRNEKPKRAHDYGSHQVLLIAKTACLKVDYQDISIKDLLGKGAFGSVYKAEYKGKVVACKKINANFLRSNSSNIDLQELTKSYLRELNAYNHIKGVNVLKMIGYCTNESVQSLDFVILTEFMSKGNLTSVLKNEPNLSYRRRLYIAIDIACGMSRIHDLRFIHRDIRPDNILIDGNYLAKIGDMGIAKEVDPKNPKNTIVGCIRYMPPEFYSGLYDQKLDVYTFGLTLNETFNGCHKKIGLKIEIVNKAPVFYEKIVKCIEEDPAKRPTSKEIESQLKLFQAMIDKLVRRLNSGKYQKLSTKEKNDMFVRLYKSCLDIELQPAGLGSNLYQANQYYTQSNQRASNQPPPSTQQKQDNKTCHIL